MNHSQTPFNRDATKIVSAKPIFSKADIIEIQTSVKDILDSGQLILGEHTRHFEHAFKTYIGTEYAVAFSTCTAVIQTVLRYYRVTDREVILPTNNFIGVVSAILQEGGTPVFTDIDPKTFCIDIDDLISRITSNTAGVIVVDLAGLIPQDIDNIRAICEEKGIFLLEDASHAHGAELDGRKAGSLADAGCFSFYPTKIMTTGTGGMLTTNDAKLARYARSVRHHGVGDGLHNVVNLGNDWCLSEIHAVLGKLQLSHLNDNLTHRNLMINRYRSGLEHLPWLSIPVYPDNVRHAYYKFPILLQCGAERDRFRRILNEEYHIENGTIYDPPCHLQPIMKNLFGYNKGMYPKAEETLSRQLCPPIHSAITEAEVDKVIEAVIATGERCGFGSFG